MVAATQFLTALSNVSKSASTANGSSQPAASAGDAARLQAAIATFGSFASALNNSTGMQATAMSPAGTLVPSGAHPFASGQNAAPQTMLPNGMELADLQAAIQSMLANSSFGDGALGNNGTGSLPGLPGNLNAAELGAFINGEAGSHPVLDGLLQGGPQPLSGAKQLSTLPADLAADLAEKFASLGISQDRASDLLNKLSTLLTGGQSATGARPPGLAAFMEKLASGEIKLPAAVQAVIDKGGSVGEVRQALVDAGVITTTPDQFTPQARVLLPFLAGLASGDIELPTSVRTIVEDGGTLSDLRQALAEAGILTPPGEASLLALEQAATSTTDVPDIGADALQLDPVVRAGLLPGGLVPGGLVSGGLVSGGLVSGGLGLPGAQAEVSLASNTAEQLVARQSAMAGDRAALVEAAKEIAKGLRNSAKADTAPKAQANEHSAPLANLISQLRSGEISIESAREALLAGGRPDIASRLAALSNGATASTTGPASEGASSQIGGTSDLKSAATPKAASTLPVAERMPVMPQVPPGGLAKAFGEDAQAMKGQRLQAAQQGGENATQTTKVMPEAAAKALAAQSAAFEAARDPSTRPEAAALFHPKANGAAQLMGLKPSRPGAQTPQAQALQAQPTGAHPAQPAQSVSPATPAATAPAVLEVEPPRPISDGAPAGRSADLPTAQAPAPTPAAMTSAPAQEMAEVSTPQSRAEVVREHGLETRITTLRFDAQTRAAAVHDMSIAITRFAGRGLSRFQIRLDPAELGRVDVRLEIGRDGRVAAQVTADRPETLDILRQDSRALERAFQDAGLKTDQNSLNFSLKEQNTGAQHGQNGNPQPTWSGENQSEGDDVISAREIERIAIPDEIVGGLRLMGTRGIDVTV